MEKEPDVEVITDETEETLSSTSEVTVDLDKQPAKPDVPKEEPKSPEISKLNNTIAYQTRQLEKAMREMQELKTQISRPQTVQREPENKDEIDEIAQRDWKQGVKKVVEKDIEAKVQEILEKRDAALREVQQRVTQESELEKSKQKVFERYPEIENPTTEESRVFREVLNEDNSLFKNIHGPEIAMYRMEERLRQMGRTPQSVKPIVDREVSRLARAGASNVIGRQSSPNGKITLTREQKEFCDNHKISYEQYAKSLKAQDAIGGVEV